MKGWYSVIYKNHISQWGSKEDLLEYLKQLSEEELKRIESIEECGYVHPRTFMTVYPRDVMKEILEELVENEEQQ